MSPHWKSHPEKKIVILLDISMYQEQFYEIILLKKNIYLKLAEELGVAWDKNNILNQILLSKNIIL